MDRRDRETDRLQRTERGLTSRTRAGDLDFKRLDAVLLRLAACIFSSHLRSVRRGFARALEPHGASEDQEIAFPCASVMVIMVLLKLAFTCATPAVMFLRSRRRTRDGSFAITLVPYFFLPAIGLAGPLRVRALVCVRWPRTGRPRR